jgi:hypothetical protein
MARDRDQKEPDGLDPAEVELEIEAAVADVVDKVNDPGAGRSGERARR